MTLLAKLSLVLCNIDCLVLFITVLKIDFVNFLSLSTLLFAIYFFQLVLEIFVTSFVVALRKLSSNVLSTLTMIQDIVTGFSTFDDVLIYSRTSGTLFALLRFTFALNFFVFISHSLHYIFDFFCFVSW